MRFRVSESAYTWRHGGVSQGVVVGAVVTSRPHWAWPTKISLKATLHAHERQKRDRMWGGVAEFLTFYIAGANLGISQNRIDLGDFPRGRSMGRERFSTRATPPQYLVGFTRDLCGRSFFRAIPRLEMAHGSLEMMRRNEDGECEVNLGAGLFLPHFRKFADFCGGNFDHIS